MARSLAEHEVSSGGFFIHCRSFLKGNYRIKMISNSTELPPTLRLRPHQNIASSAEIKHVGKLLLQFRRPVVG